MLRPINSRSPRVGQSNWPTLGGKIHPRLGCGISDSDVLRQTGQPPRLRNSRSPYVRLHARIKSSDAAAQLNRGYERERTMYWVDHFPGVRLTANPARRLGVIINISESDNLAEIISVTPAQSRPYVPEMMRSKSVACHFRGKALNISN